MATLTVAFRGHREQLRDNAREGGKFLALVSLMAEVISHLGRATKYFSTEIQNQLIHLLANTVKSTSGENINYAPFWNIILDSTSNITRVYQLSVVIMWEKVTEDECTIVKSFVAFVKINNPSADGTVNTARSIFGKPWHRFIKNKKSGL